MSINTPINQSVSHLLRVVRSVDEFECPSEESVRFVYYESIKREVGINKLYSSFISKFDEYCMSTPHPKSWVLCPVVYYESINVLFIMNR